MATSPPINKWNSRKLVGVATFFGVSTSLLVTDFISEEVWQNVSTLAFIAWVGSQAAIDALSQR